ncbi:MAG: AcrB/AcrD/AcrF family transporter [Bacillales bacterium]|jgi:HAE1 family hydrophobic/amphiphilic exporter-1|nr:AcrB/AcrD/AcrF family transporter [Bacillales bacterium]
MNGIINFVLKNKFAVWIMTICVIVAGLYSGMTMKMEQMPNISIPVVMLTTVYPGATPEQVAEKITEPIEQAVQNVSGVNLVMSNSFQNASSIQIQFDYEKDMDKAEKEIADAVANVTLPDGVTKPDPSRFSFDMIPIVAYGVESKELGLSKLTKKMESQVVPALKSIEGIQNVSLAGQQLQEVQIEFNQSKLAEIGMTEETVKLMIQGAKAKFPLGVLELDKSEKSVVIDGNITTLDELKNIQIPVVPKSSMTGQTGASTGMPSGMAQGSTSAPQQKPTGNMSSFIPQMVKLSDIADIQVIGKAESIARTNGKEAITFAIFKTTAGNTVEVADKVDQKLEDFEKDMPGLKFSKTMDMATPVKESVSTMLNKAIIGALFAVVIIWLFLRSFKSTIIAVVSIPLSILIAMLCLQQLDITLNMMTLGAMTVAIGRIIDDSIVVIENIFRRMSIKTEKLSGKDLIREATKEVFVPILSSTLVTIAVFLPLGLVGGMIGQMFLPFALAIVFSLLASLLVAITIVPMLTRQLFKKGLSEKHIHEEGKHSQLALKYESLLRWSLDHKWIPSLISILMLVGSFTLVPYIGVNFMNSEDEKMIYMNFKPHAGKTLEDADQAVKQMEELLLSDKNVESIQISAGGMNPFDPGNNKNATATVTYKKSTKNFTEKKESVLKKLASNNDLGVWKEQDFGQGTTSTVTYYVYGPSMNDLTETVANVEKVMKANKNLKNVESSMKEAYDEYSLVVDQPKAAMMGLSAGQIGMALFQNPTRPTLTTVVKDGEELNVYVETKKDMFKSIDDIKNKMITTPMGVQVPLSTIVTVKEGKTSDTIARRDGKVFASISGTPKTKDVGAITKEVQNKVDKIKTPEGISIETGGVSKDIQDSFTKMGLAMLAAVAIVYMILVITFGGALAPFAILFSLPLTIIGALLGLFIAGETIDITALIGMLMLIGIVVTNAIVLIDRVLHKEAEGKTVREALLDAAVTRLRPILMTAIATIGALIPLALGLEGSGMISKGLAVTVIGGLTSSTLLTLVIVPIVYESLSRFKRKNVDA